MPISEDGMAIKATTKREETEGKRSDDPVV